MLAHLGSDVTGALNGDSHMGSSVISRRTERVSDDDDERHPTDVKGYPDGF